MSETGITEKTPIDCQGFQISTDGEKWLELKGVKPDGIPLFDAETIQKLGGDIVKFKICEFSHSLLGKITLAKRT